MHFGICEIGLLNTIADNISASETISIYHSNAQQIFVEFCI